MKFNKKNKEKKNDDPNKQMSSPYLKWEGRTWGYKAKPAHLDVHFFYW
jgi:hypothetical protein